MVMQIEMRLMVRRISLLVKIQGSADGDKAALARDHDAI